MRVTDKMVHTQVVNNLQSNRGEMSDLQNKAATQKRITKPSDDPAAAARVLTARTEERGAAQYIKNINYARSFLEFTDQSLSELAESLMRAKELAIQQASDAGASGDTRRVVAMEVEQIYNQAVQIGNRKLADRYIFGGFNTTSPPFDISGEYTGDDGDMKIHINKDAFVAMNVSGDKVFLGQGLSEDGLVKVSGRVPRNSQELKDKILEDRVKAQKNEELESEPLPLRGPATSNPRDQKTFESVTGPKSKGVDVLGVLKDFEIALRTNDKEEIQDAIDGIDAALNQVVNARAAVGSRVTSLNAATDSLQKSTVDQKVVASQLEDADLFQVVSDMNKTDSTLKATLETSGKVMNLSLLDFLR
ncbi:MAG: flagellar hook-associated protein FlgL [Proteobacteria bacterium]|nr:flagellar hook-associated protein FlgL [Pseudomonadota bacterium]